MRGYNYIESINRAIVEGVSPPQSKKCNLIIRFAAPIHALTSIILVPKLSTKDYFFSRKLVLFNMTFASPGKDAPAHCVLWHEEQARRSASEITNSYFTHLNKHRDNKQIVIYCDNCSSQNKNRTLYGFLLRYVNETSHSSRTITMKYFEPSHTNMPADSVHGSIATSIKSQDLHDFDHFVKTIQDSRKNLSTSILTYDDFRLYEPEIKSSLGWKDRHRPHPHTRLESTVSRLLNASWNMWKDRRRLS